MPAKFAKLASWNSRTARPVAKANQPVAKANQHVAKANRPVAKANRPTGGEIVNDMRTVFLIHGPSNPLRLSNLSIQ
jgi:hypothetical protein